MPHIETKPSSQRDISGSFLNIFRQLKEVSIPGRIFELNREPTKDELKFLIANYEKEVGLLRLNQTGKWIMLEGINKHYVEIPIQLAYSSDIIAHSHPSRRNNLPALPTFMDVLNVNNPKGEIIFNPNGLTYFSEVKKNPLTEQPWKPKTFEDLEQFLPKNHVEIESRCGLVNSNETENFFNRIGVKIVRKLWKELPNNPLSGFNPNI